MKSTSLITAALMVGALAGLAGCKKSDEAMGPAQKAGQAVDQAGEKVARDLHAGIDKANDAARQVAKSAEDTTAKINEATEDASKGLNKATEEVGKKIERAGEKIQESAKK